jgi:hypothetical protein
VLEQLAEDDEEHAADLLVLAARRDCMQLLGEA